MAWCALLAANTGLRQIECWPRRPCASTLAATLLAATRRFAATWQPHRWQLQGDALPRGSHTAGSYKAMCCHVAATPLAATRRCAAIATHAAETGTAKQRA